MVSFFDGAQIHGEKKTSIFSDVIEIHGKILTLKCLIKTAE